jgi:hypothetical protein
MTRSALQIFLEFASSFVEIDLELNYDAQALVGELQEMKVPAAGARACSALDRLRVGGPAMSLKRHASRKAGK